MPRIELTDLERQKMAKAGAESIKAGGWQPIESAPKDGRCVLAYWNWKDDDVDEHFISIAYWNGSEWEDVHNGIYEYGKWEENGSESFVHDITHWMPLPEPPK